jgi:hypothetical protein
VASADWSLGSDDIGTEALLFISARFIAGTASIQIKSAASFRSKARYKSHRQSGAVDLNVVFTTAETTPDAAN